MQVRTDEHGKFMSATIRRPSNFHAHLRRDALMRAVAKHIMNHVFYLLVMPNNGPIRTMEDAREYYDQLMALAREHVSHELRLVMTLYHTKDTTPAVIEGIAASAFVHAVKHYPPHPGATTGSGLGIPLEDSHEMLRAMEVNRVPLLGHFESVFDKYNRPLAPEDGEKYMVDNYLWRLRDKYPNLRICCEHASTIEMVRFVEADTSGNTVLTATPHHSLFCADDFALWGPDLKCKPIVQTRENRDAILAFITSGDSRAIAGDDTAPHLSKTKHVEFERAANGCWLPHATPLYASAFMHAGAMDYRFEKFMALNGPEWWGFDPPAEDNVISIVRDTDNDMPEPVPVPEEDDVVVPLGWAPEAHQLRIGLAMAT